MVKYNADREQITAKWRKERKENPDKFKERSRIYRQNNPEAVQKQNDRSRDYYAANREKMVESERLRRKNNADVIRQREKARAKSPSRKAMSAKYREANREALAEKARNDRQTDPDRFKVYDQRRYSQTKFRLTRSLNAAVRRHIKQFDANYSGRNRRHSVGWSTNDLVEHMISLFEEGMSWENWGEWQIDHVIPIAAVPVESDDDPVFKELWSLSNLAPLWAPDNNSKHHRLDWQLPDTYKNPLLRGMYEKPAMAHLVKAIAA